MKVWIVTGGFAGMEAQLRANKYTQEVQELEASIQRRRADLAAAERRLINLKATAAAAEATARQYHATR